ncbi:plastocyanin/azurin family copper-binding protein [Halorarum salinum]|uniref:Halocyanin n=1 Tax=Halorarum salinum TaxID=2743089 RepID=A0A7D5LCH8_9EURY|nr:plastocyanin/azurin family copper-binding protein [Halobaculum salinum]QLG62775.1 halocyanin [Halobaculum salinum]
MRRRRFLATAGAAATLAVSGCLGDALAEDDYDVGMTAEAFRPREFTTTVGEEVVWANTSSRAHSVTAYEDTLPEGADYFATGGFDSEAAARDAWDGNDGAITSGETFSHAFEVAGEYSYLCIPHERAGMVGTVVVEE